MGFEHMPESRRKKIAKKGGKAAVGRHRWTSEEARKAGQKSRKKKDTTP